MASRGATREAGKATRRPAARTDERPIARPPKTSGPAKTIGVDWEALNAKLNAALAANYKGKAQRAKIVEAITTGIKLSIEATTPRNVLDNLTHYEERITLSAAAEKNVYPIITAALRQHKKSIAAQKAQVVEDASLAARGAAGSQAGTLTIGGATRDERQDASKAAGSGAGGRDGKETVKARAGADAREGATVSSGAAGEGVKAPAATDEFLRRALEAPVTLEVVERVGLFRTKTYIFHTAAPQNVLDLLVHGYADAMRRVEALEAALLKAEETTLRGRVKALEAAVASLERRGRLAVKIFFKRIHAREKEAGAVAARVEALEEKARDVDFALENFRKWVADIRENFGETITETRVAVASTMKAIARRLGKAEKAFKGAEVTPQNVAAAIAHFGQEQLAELKFALGISAQSPTERVDKAEARLDELGEQVSKLTGVVGDDGVGVLKGKITAIEEALRTLSRELARVMREVEAVKSTGGASAQTPAGGEATVNGASASSGEAAAASKGGSGADEVVIEAPDETSAGKA